MNVEDDQFTQDFIKEILEEEGHTVLTARDADAFFKQLEEQKDVDLVLLDIMLPGRSGWDIFGELRRRSPDLKVVFVSAIEISGERLTSLKEDGLFDYVVKPFTDTMLLDVVKRALGLAEQKSDGD